MFDLDGTLVLGDRTGKSYDVLPGAVEVLTRLRERDFPYLVLTNGSAHPPAAQAAKLQTRWYFNDKVVEESSEMISPTGPAVTEFHLSKPDGWPVGNYKIEVLLNGAPAGSKSFEVKPIAS